MLAGKKKTSHTTAHVLGTKTFMIFMKHPNSSRNVRINATNVDTCSLQHLLIWHTIFCQKMEAYFSPIYYKKYF